MKDRISSEWGLYPQELTGVKKDLVTSSDPEWIEEENNRLKKFEAIDNEKTTIDYHIKVMARSGIPVIYRKKWWCIASGGYQLLSTVGDVWESSVASSASYPMTSSRAFGAQLEMLDFVPAEMVNDLKLLLHVIWTKNRNIDFCPLIPTVAALLLIYMDVNVAFACLQAMINRSMVDKWFFSIGKNNFLAYVQGTSNWIKNDVPRVYEHAMSIGINPVQVCLHLLPAFFLPYTPLEVAMTIFDSYMIEGRKILFRFCVNLFVAEKAMLIKSTTSEGFIHVLVNGLEKLRDVKVLKTFIKKSYSKYISREKHIIPTEKRILRDKEGILGSRLHTTAPNVREMLTTNPELMKKRTLSLPSSNLSSLLKENESNSLSTQIMERALPSIIGGRLLNANAFYTLRASFPMFQRKYSAECVYSMSKNGSTFEAFLREATKKGDYILAIQTESSVCGGFFTQLNLSARGRSSGEPYTLVFRLDPVQVYRAIPSSNRLFIQVTREYLLIGGPDPAIHVDDGFKNLSSCPCDTFKSPSLISGKLSERILDVELYRLVMST